MHNLYQSLAAKLNIQTNIRRKRKSQKFIELKIGSVQIFDRKTENDEAYNLRVYPQEEIIRIIGNTPKGVFWGIQSLLSITNDLEVPWVSVEDSPRYLYRGLSIDVARNFLPKAEVMRIINGMAMFKMNKLHLHMSDDEGWRLEIPGLKELTEVGYLSRERLKDKGGWWDKRNQPTLVSTIYYSTCGFSSISRAALNKMHTDFVQSFFSVNVFTINRVTMKTVAKSKHYYRFVTCYVKRLFSFLRGEVLFLQC